MHTRAARGVQYSVISPPTVIYKGKHFSSAPEQNDVRAEVSSNPVLVERTNESGPRINESGPRTYNHRTRPSAHGLRLYSLTDASRPASLTRQAGPEGSTPKRQGSCVTDPQTVKASSPWEESSPGESSPVQSSSPSAYIPQLENTLLLIVSLLTHCVKSLDKMPPATGPDSGTVGTNHPPTVSVTTRVIMPRS